MAYFIAAYVKKIKITICSRGPCTSRMREQGHSQNTTLSASDLNNIRAAILNPFYNIEYKIIKKIWQDKTWIEADIPCIISLPICVMHLSQSLSTSAMTSQSQSTLWRQNSSEWNRKRFEFDGSALEHNSISSNTRAKPWVFDSVNVKGNQMKLFQ